MISTAPISIYLCVSLYKCCKSIQSMDPVLNRRGGSPRSLDVKWTAHSSIATPLPQQMQMLWNTHWPGRLMCVCVSEDGVAMGSRQSMASSSFSILKYVNIAILEYTDGILHTPDLICRSKNHSCWPMSPRQHHLQIPGNIRDDRGHRTWGGLDNMLPITLVSIEQTDHGSNKLTVVSIILINMVYIYTVFFLVGQ